MTTRRKFLGLVGAGGAAALAGCTPAVQVQPPLGRGTPDVLLGQAGDGLVRVQGSQVGALGAAITTPDAKTIFSAVPVGPDTDLLAIDPASGRTVSTTRLTGTWRPRTAAVSGRQVALSRPEPAGGAYVPAGRSRTELLVAGPGQEQVRLDLAGNYAPDAFAADGTAVFVLDWLPPTAPDRYRVRAVDLATRTPAQLLTRDKSPVPLGAEEEMSGEGRAAVYVPQDRVLYTLYTHQPDHQHTRDLRAGRRGDVHAFVHTLHLEQRWAYCVDLPAPFGNGPAAAHTIVAAPGGRFVYVADVSSGKIAVIVAETLAVLGVKDLAKPETGTQPEPAYAAATADLLFIGAGNRIQVLATADLRPLATWRVEGAVRGLAVSPDGMRLYAGEPGAVTWLDTATGTRLGGLPVPGLTAVTRALDAV